jgi:phage gp29-like protein
MGLRTFLASLMGIASYQALPANATDVTGEDLDRYREQTGNDGQPPTQSKTRWYLRELEAAVHAADSGDLAPAAKLVREVRSDGVLAGVLSTRTSGLVRLPRRLRGEDDIIASLEARSGATRSVFDEMCPAAELAKLTDDGVLLGVGLAEMVRVRGRSHKLLVRRDPEFLRYQWSNNQWYFRSTAGLIPIRPGDGRWVLHTPGGRSAPWQGGLWRAVGRAFIRKEHAANRRDSWEMKLANPARVAVAPAGATDSHSLSWFQKVLAWGTNTVFGVKPGYDVKLVESNGRGADSFKTTIAEQNETMTIAVAGQTVTTDGGAGFQNSDIHRSIRSDLIKDDADALAHTINTQVLPQWIADRYGMDAALRGAAAVEWDVTPPKDRAADAQALMQFASALRVLSESLEPYKRRPDIDPLLVRFGVPTVAVKPGDMPLLTETSDEERMAA